MIGSVNGLVSKSIAIEFKGLYIFCRERNDTLYTTVHKGTPGKSLKSKSKGPAPSETSWPPTTPKLTVDAVIRTSRGIVLIERRHEPFGWALPGGFVEVGETVEKAAVREANEETGLMIENLWLVGVYSDPRRDPRFHTVGVVFGATAHGMPYGADDALIAREFGIEQLPEDIVFDHRRIIGDFLRLESMSEARRVQMPG